MVYGTNSVVGLERTSLLAGKALVRGEDWNSGKGERRVDNGDIEDLELMGTGERLDGG